MEMILDLLLISILRGGTYILMAMGLGIVFGVMNIPNFAHGEFYMLGAYFGYFAYTYFNLGPLASIAAAAIGVFIIGAFTEILLFRPLRSKSKEGTWLMNTFLLTLGIGIILQNIMKAIFGFTFKGVPKFWSGSINLLSGMKIPVDRIMGFVIAIITVAIFWYFLNYTRTGRAIKSVSEDEVGAQLSGVNLKNIYTLTFALSAGLAGIAGSSLLSINSAYPMMGMMPLYKSWFVIILIGMGNVGPIIIGGIIVGVLETVSYYIFGAGWQDAVSLAVIILILIFKPEGLFGKKGVRSIWEQ
jgi:branched-chain amino acid transport system permease protein